MSASAAVANGVNNRQVPGYPRRVVVLGATGSIGLQSLAVIRAHPGLFSVVGIAAGRLSPTLLGLVAEFEPEWAAVSTPEPDGRSQPDGRSTTERSQVQWLIGDTAAEDLVRQACPDVVINAIPGLAGLMPALAALERPIILGMASKEPIVAAGSLLLQAAAAGGAVLVPVDSEPAGVAQCLGNRSAAEIERVVLTASGGPFWGRDQASLAQVPPAEALRHPSWRMGAKISVDSATLFNKGLEAIEIALLFGVPLASVDILVHRQSVVHALVEFRDGSIQAQLGPADMRIPISQALFWPGHAPSPPSRLTLDGLSLEFVRPATAEWPCLAAALSAGAQGGLAPAAVSAADEVLVQSYLSGQLEYGLIGPGLWAVLGALRDAPPMVQSARTPTPPADLAPIVAIDRWARECARQWVAGRAGVEADLPLWAAREGVN